MLNCTGISHNIYFLSFEGLQIQTQLKNLTDFLKSNINLNLFQLLKVYLGKLGCIHLFNELFFLFFGYGLAQVLVLTVVNY